MIPLFVELDAGEGQRRLARMRGRFANFRPVMAAGGPLQRAITDFARAQFRTRGRAGGHPWARLRPRTVAIKQALGVYGKGPLRRFDALYQAYTVPGAAHQVVVADPKAFVWRVTLGYARRHQEGTERMVARQVFPDELPESFQRRLRNIITGYLIGVELGDGE